MKDKKHIDRLFQERFKDFEVTPDASVWEAIEDTLQHKKKKKRRVIPIWWRAAGIAAGFIVLIAIGSLVFNSNDDDTNTPNNEMVNTKENTTPNSSETNSKNTIKSQETDSQIIASENAELENENEKLSNNSSNVSKNLPKSDVTNQFVNTSKDPGVPSQSALVNKEDKSLSTAASKNANKEVLAKNKGENRKLLSNSKLEKVVSQEPNQDSEKNTTNKENSVDIAKSNALIKNAQKNTSSTVVNVESKGETSTDTSEDVLKKEDEKPSILDGIAATAEDEDEKVADQESSKNKWNVMPNIAPVYFNSLGNGSSIHSQFKNNDKSGDINISYGVAASYNLSDKVSVRSGINKFNVGYSTNDVLIYQGLETAIGGAGRSLETINYNTDAEAITVVTSTNLPFSQVPDVVTGAIDSSLDQNLGFIEVPLEIAYKLSDKKLGFSIIGGMSALFLSENDIYSNLNGNRTLLGEANNIRNTSFTTNVGLGLDYKVSEKIDINLEPVFKYHMNTFKSKSGDFNPYTIGVYTGFSFKF